MSVRAELKGFVADRLLYWAFRLDPERFRHVWRYPTAEEWRSAFRDGMPSLGDMCESEIPPAKKSDFVSVRKLPVGWWVEGAWCPNQAVRDHRIGKLTAQQKQGQMR